MKLRKVILVVHRSKQLQYVKFSDQRVDQFLLKKIPDMIGFWKFSNEPNEGNQWQTRFQQETPRTKTVQWIINILVIEEHMSSSKEFKEDKLSKRRHITPKHSNRLEQKF